VLENETMILGNAQKIKTIFETLESIHKKSSELETYLDDCAKT
jgi:hypothetical protein